MIFNLLSSEDILSSSGFPKDVLKKHNAFPDCVKFQNKTYLTFRSAPYHQPNRESIIVVVSTLDGSYWNLEKIFKMPDFDVRDPKFIIYNNTLHLYFGIVRPIKYGKHPLGITLTKLLEDNTWTEPKQIYKDGYLHARVRILNDLLYMCVYRWNTKNPFTSESRIIVSSDGINWSENTPFGILVKEGTEADCIITNNEELLWIIRHDFSKMTDTGSSIYLISTDGDILKSVEDKRKFDSPHLFKKDGQLFLIARSQMNFKGKYNIGSSRIPKMVKNIINPSIYWLTKKGTSIWEIDEKSLSISKQIDLPSHGDTGYCSIIDRAENSFEIYNYSSLLNLKTVSWRNGQGSPTTIYKYTLNLNVK